VVGEVEEFNESFSAPVHLIRLPVNNQSVSSPHIVSKEGSFRVDLVFLWSSSSETEINNKQVLIFRVRILN